MKSALNTIVLCILAVLSLVGGPAQGESASVHSIAEFKENLHNQASLQRGAKYFMNYCSGCHSLQYARYERIGKDVGITHDNGQLAVSLMQDNLMFTSDKVGDTIKIAMHDTDSKTWFGVAPPDLSLITRARGQQWVYDYLLGFYDDPSRPWGVNNIIFPEVAMPNVLADLQGEQQPVYRITQSSKEKERTMIGVQKSQQGALSTQEFEQQMTDLVNFLVYVADPVKLERERLGVWVILVLVVLLLFSYLLKREYWKDVH